MSRSMYPASAHLQPLAMTVAEETKTTDPKTSELKTDLIHLTAGLAMSWHHCPSTGCVLQTIVVQPLHTQTPVSLSMYRIDLSDMPNRNG